MDFKAWLEANLPQPVTVFGKSVSNTEDFEKPFYHYYRKMGFTPKDISDIKMLANSDFLGDLDADQFAALDKQAGMSMADYKKLMSKSPPMWTDSKDPYFNKVRKKVLKVINSAKERDYFFLAVNKNPLANQMYRKLFKPDVTDEEVEDFIDDMISIKVLNPLKSLDRGNTPSYSQTSSFIKTPSLNQPDFDKTKVL